MTLLGMARLVGSNLLLEYIVQCFPGLRVFVEIWCVCLCSNVFSLQLLIVALCFVLLCGVYDTSQRGILWLCRIEGLSIACAYISISFSIFEKFPTIILSNRFSTSSSTHGLLGCLSVISQNSWKLYMVHILSLLLISECSISSTMPCIPNVLYSACSL